MREADLKATKKYIEVQYTPVTQGYLREYCHTNGFDLTTKFNGTTQEPDDFDFHSTVWFTSNAVVMQNESREILIDDVIPKNFAMFGPDKDILVLEIDSEKLTAIRETFGDEYALEDEWPDFAAHITLSYSHAGELPTVDLPDGDELIATTLNIKTQK